MLRSTPAAEDGAPGRSSGRGAVKSPPPGEDGINRAYPDADDADLELDAQEDAEPGSTEESDDGLFFDEKPADSEFLQMVAEADAQSLQYVSQVNRRSWERGYRAFHQEHFTGSKYTSDDYKNRSRLFIPKTRTAVRKDNAAVMASMFGSIDAVNCMAGNEGDAEQRASAAVMQELLNYRTDRSDMKASIPWFHIAMGARQTALFTGICLSKQSWKLELKRTGTEEFTDENDGQKKLRDVWKPHIDRCNSELFPPENFTIDPAADWTNPAQDAAYLILKYPMRIDEIRRRQRDPRRPWKNLPESVLRAAGEGARMEAEAIRRAREQGIDRYDKSQTTTHFDIIWVWETFMRTAGEDWTFMSIGSQHLLTDPAPVEEVYPEQGGARPVVMGYGSLEAFRIFPMSNVESWQMLQQESNDIRNLSLDSLKQNIMPVTKVVRGRNVDMDQLKRRGQGTAIMVTSKDDVTWEKVQSVGAEVQALTQKLDIEFDDLSGQQNYGTVQDNNNLGKTLGGLKLAAGAANAVQEYDIRIWIETWCEPVLNQLVRLEQYYESDPIVLGLCGERAQLLQKHGINEITDQLLENTVTVRVNVGLGSGDPQQRLAKFQSAISMYVPLAQMDPDFKSGKKQMDGEAIRQEIFGAAGYRDGGKRFEKVGQPQGPNPVQDATTDKLKSEAERNRASAKAQVVTALSAAAKVGLGLKELENEWINSQFDNHMKHVQQVGDAHKWGHEHGMALAAAKNAAAGLNPDGSPMQAPGEGGDAPPPAGGGGGEALPPVQDPGAGNAGVDPSQLGQHAVPASDAGQQHEQDAAAAAKNLERSQPRKRKVTIAKRGPDGRASEFHIED